MDELMFEEIYNATARPLWAYVARISGSATAADDIVQETYLRFLSSPPRTGEARPYLYKIATNLVYDRFRRQKREGRQEELTATSEALPARTPAEAEMTQVFGRLGERERALLWLAYVEGREHREIAEILKLNTMSVRVLLFRARRKLAAMLVTENK